MVDHILRCPLESLAMSHAVGSKVYLEASQLSRTVRHTSSFMLQQDGVKIPRTETVRLDSKVRGDSFK